MKHRIFLPLLLFLLALTAWAAAAGPAGTVDVRYYDEEAGAYGPIVQADAVGLVLDGAPLEGSSAAFMRLYSSNYGRVLLPLRMVGEALNTQVIWVPETRQAMLIRGSATIVLTLGSDTALVNGSPVPLPDGVPAGLAQYNGMDVTMVPARFVAEHLGATVSWDGDNYTAVLTTGALSPAPTPPPAEIKGDLGYVDRFLTDDNAQSLYVVTDYLPEYTVYQTGQKVVIDLLGANLGGELADGSLPIENDLIHAVRYAQHDTDLDNGYAHTVRVVLDLREGITLKQNLTLRREQGGLRIETALLPEQKPKPAPDPELPAKPGQRTVVLDAGHGGSASGAVYEGIMEKDLTLPMVQKLARILSDQGCRVILTRRDDSAVDLYERAAIANAAQADVFVSIHCNATTVSDSYEGLYTYYYPGSSRGKALANKVQSAAAAATGAVDRGLLSNNFVVLRETTMPAVLVETGFMTSHGELMRLADSAYQQKMAQGIADGIIRYLDTLN